MRGDGDAIAELDLKRPEQSLEFCQREVPQLATGDDLRHPFLLFVARPRRSGPFLRPGCDDRQGKACRRRSQRLNQEKKERRAVPCVMWGHRWR